MNSKTVLNLASYAVLRDDLVCFNKISGEIITLNQSGYLFLRLLGQSRSIGQISECVAEIYKVSCDSVITDSLDFYQKMIFSEMIMETDIE